MVDYMVFYEFAYFIIIHIYTDLYRTLVYNCI